MKVWPTLRRVELSITVNLPRIAVDTHMELFTALLRYSLQLEELLFEPIVLYKSGFNDVYDAIENAAQNNHLRNLRVYLQVLGRSGQMISTKYPFRLLLRFMEKFPNIQYLCVNGSIYNETILTLLSADSYSDVVSDRGEALCYAAASYTATARTRCKTS